MASHRPAPGTARVLQPSLAEDVQRQAVHGDKRAGIYTETGAAFTAWLPAPEAVAFARHMAETYGRPYRVVYA